MKKLEIFISVMAAFFLLLFALVLIGYRPPNGELHLTSMEESGEAMQQTGQTMLTHGQTMLDEGRRTANQALVSHGQHWLSDGQLLVQRGQWMAMNPLASSSLQSSQSDLAKQGNWSELIRNAQAMVHNPQQIGATDLKALRWNGQGMLSEGQNMAEHGRLMAEEVAVMVKQEQLSLTAANELRQAAQIILQTGGHLAQNGQVMMDYAGRQLQSLGYR